MIDLTNEQLIDLYGEDDQEDWEPDFSKWVAVQALDSFENWAIAPKVFWENNGFIPDWCLGFRVPGFRESNEHVLSPKMSTSNTKEALIKLGFTIIENPVWGFDRKKKYGKEI